MPEERDEVIVLIDDEGNEVEFEFLTTIDMDEKEYVVLLPIEENNTGEDMETEEVVILKIEQDKEGEDTFASIEDEDELNKVFEEFKKVMEEEFDFDD